MASAKVFRFQNYIGQEFWFEKGEYIYLIKRNKSDIKIKKNADVENCGELKSFGFIYIYIEYIDKYTYYYLKYNIS